MSFDADASWLLVAPLLLGHLGLFVVVVNVVHAFRISDRWLDLIKLMILGLILAIGGLIVNRVLSGPIESWGWAWRVYTVVCLGIGLLALPLTSLVRLSRRTPRGIDGRSAGARPGRGRIRGERRRSSARDDTPGCSGSPATNRSGSGSMSGRSRSRTFPRPGMA